MQLLGKNYNEGVFSITAGLFQYGKGSLCHGSSCSRCPAV